ncbi:MAG: DUF5689 domain-containing protein [Tenacibaculum sp.]
MQTIKLLKTILWLFFLANLVSCVKNNAYSLPEITIEEPDVKVTNSIQSIKKFYNDDIVDFSTVSKDGQLVIEGYVISSDEAGNLFKQLYIQDKPESPSAAIRLAIDATDMYTYYNVGRKVYVKLSGLGLHNARGVLEIGKIKGASVDRIPASSYKDYVLRSSEVAEIAPLQATTISSLQDSHIGMLVSLSDMQTGSKNQTYADVNSLSSVNIPFKSCADGGSIIVRNSGFADFKAESIPNAKGILTGVFSKFDDDYQLFIRDTKDVNFTESRCDFFFEEDFSSENLDLLWTPISVEGSQKWRVEEKFGNPKPCGRISGFSSGAKKNEDWLISKAIDLTEATGKVTLSFDNVKRFGGKDLEVYYSTNYNGENPNDSNNTWIQLKPKIDDDTGSWSSWVSSGDLDISMAVGGNVFIAFKYMSTNSQAPTYQIDNIIIR